ncbi:MAG TPA: endonuclease/exonuclease/phosphatase family protein [Alphaproteobacteria bacterium]|nr:endonuclease/exonuclease/phosphatase family protein [Alphaproteobacteria bacterium]
MIIASYNLDGLDDTGEDPRDFGARVAVLRPKLVDLDAEILCLQEVRSQRIGAKRRLRALERLLEGTRYARYHRVHTVTETGRATDVNHLVILSSFPILRHGKISHELVPPLPCHQPVRGSRCDPISWDRPFLYALLDCGEGRHIWIVNLHLRAPIAARVPQGRTRKVWRSTPLWAEGFFRAALMRIGQALEVRLFVDRLFDEDPTARICVCGDFNAEGAEMPLRLIRADPEDTEAPALRSRRLLPLDRAGSSAVHAGRPMRPDHLLASTQLAAAHRRSDLINRNLPDDTQVGAVDSPHAPILAEFDLRRVIG